MKYSIFLSTVLTIFVLTAGAQQSGWEQASLQITPAITQSLIDSIGHSLYRNYIFPDSSLKMARYLEGQYKKGAYAGINNPQDLAYRLNQDMQKVHHDGHLRLHYAPLMAKELSDTFGMAERRRIRDSLDLIDIRQQNFLFSKVEILPGNIGYVKFNGFVNYINEARPTITSAFRFLTGTRAVIIDLRDNGGGSPVMVCQVESYFFSRPTHMNDIVDSRNHKLIFWTDPAKADNLILQMPVYILTSRRTFSGAEDFSYGMQSVHRATIVGDTTGGGAHPTRPVPIMLGFVADIPFAYSLNPITHTDWEGTGVIPDITCSSNDALLAAEKAIFADWIGHAAGEPEKRKAEWQLNDLLGRQSPGTSDPVSLSSYVGTYQGGLVFYIDGSSLFCRNGERGNYLSKLYPISGDQFLLDENVHVTFKKGENGSVNAIEMWFSDGRVIHKPKEK